jgi:hypothetical protein
LNLSEYFYNFEKSILAFADSKNLNIMSPNTHSGISLESENQCLFAKLKNSFIYFISHDDVNLFENYFDLTAETMMKIQNIRSFIYGVYASPDDRKQKCLKVIYEKEQHIDFSIFGDCLPSLRIELRETEMRVSWLYGNTVSVDYSLSDDFEQKLNEALSLVKPKVLNILGFDEHTEHSEEVITFMNKSTQDLLVEHFAKFDFNYIHKDDLIEKACAELDIHVDDLLKHNKDVKEPHRHVKIPHDMTALLPKIIKQLSKDKDSETKFKQFINLMSFYADLRSTTHDASISFKNYGKHELAPSSCINSEYCHFALFGGSLLLTLGNQLKPDDNIGSLYEQCVDGESENGYQYQFESYIGNKKYDVNSKLFKYFTNDIDFVYNTVLNEIRTVITETIATTPDELTARQIEVFKMMAV